MEQKKGISLITLMITIVIVIILAAAVILTISDNNPVENARVASVTQTKDGIESAILAYVSKIKAQTLGKYDTDYIILGKTYDNVSLDEYRIVEKTEEEYTTTTVTKNEEEYTIYKLDKTEFESKIDMLPTPPVKGCDWYVDEDGKVYLIFEKEGTMPTWMTNEAGEIEDITLKTFVAYKSNKITSSAVQENPTLYYGKTVTNYSANGVDSWKVFHADGEYIYLISSNYVPWDKLPSYLTNGLTQNETYPNAVNLTNALNDSKYSKGTESISLDNPARDWLGFLKTNTSSYNNMKAVAYLMDTEQWILYKDSNGKAKWVIGGPTLDLFVASYNNYYKDNELVSVKSIYFKPSSYGYMTSQNNDESYTGTATYTIGLTRNEMFYRITSSPKCLGLWLASPSYEASNRVMYVGNYTVGQKSTADTVGIRPVVCLNKSVGLILNDDDTVTLK